ncbi:phage tail protein [Trujillonella humicola]|uniref:phage tail protein n=1 Tax=Trujillonella humicola TaxID=3383699 RepID=UPI003906A510
MTEPFMASIQFFSFNFPPKGWAFCNGQFLPINQNQALFALLGTTYGGNGQTNFALPNLRGRVPVHTGVLPQGAAYGSSVVTVTQAQLPPHTHRPMAATGRGSAATPAAGGTWAAGSRAPLFTGGADTAMADATVSDTGGSQPHDNRQPYLVLNACIALTGIFPSQN